MPKINVGGKVLDYVGADASNNIIKTSDGKYYQKGTNGKYRPVANGESIFKQAQQKAKTGQNYNKASGFEQNKKYYVVGNSSYFTMVDDDYNTVYYKDNQKITKEQFLKGANCVYDAKSKKYVAKDLKTKVAQRPKNAKTVTKSGRYYVQNNGNRLYYEANGKQISERAFLDIENAYIDSDGNVAPYDWKAKAKKAAEGIGDMFLDMFSEAKPVYKRTKSGAIALDSKGHPIPERNKDGSVKTDRKFSLGRTCTTVVAGAVIVAAAPFVASAATFLGASAAVASTLSTITGLGIAGVFGYNGAKKMYDAEQENQNVMLSNNERAENWKKKGQGGTEVAMALGMAKGTVKNAPKTRAKLEQKQIERTNNKFNKMIEESNDMSQVRAKLSNDPKFQKLSQTEQRSLIGKINAREAVLENKAINAEPKITVRKRVANAYGKVKQRFLNWKQNRQAENALPNFEKMIEESNDMSQVRAKLSNDPKFQKLPQAEQRSLIGKINAREAVLENKAVNAEPKITIRKRVANAYGKVKQRFLNWKQNRQAENALPNFEKMIEESNDMSQVRAKLSNDPKFQKLSQAEQRSLIGKINARARLLEARENAHNVDVIKAEVKSQTPAQPQTQTPAELPKSEIVKLGKRKPAEEQHLDKKTESTFEKATKNGNNANEVAPARTVKLGKEKFAEVKKELAQMLENISDLKDTKLTTLQKRIDAIQNRGQRRELQKMFDAKKAELKKTEAQKPQPQAEPQKSAFSEPSFQKTKIPENETLFEKATSNVDSKNNRVIAKKGSVSKLNETNFAKVKESLTKALKEINSKKDSKLATIQRRINTLGDKAQRQELQKVLDAKKTELGKPAQPANISKPKTFDEFLEMINESKNMSEVRAKFSNNPEFEKLSQAEKRKLLNHLNKREASLKRGEGYVDLKMQEKLKKEVETPKEKAEPKADNEVKPSSKETPKKSNGLINKLKNVDKIKLAKAMALAGTEQDHEIEKPEDYVFDENETYEYEEKPVAPAPETPVQKVDKSEPEEKALDEGGAEAPVQDPADNGVNPPSDNIDDKDAPAPPEPSATPEVPATPATPTTPAGTDTSTPSAGNDAPLATNTTGNNTTGVAATNSTHETTSSNTEEKVEDAKIKEEPDIDPELKRDITQKVLQATDEEDIAEALTTLREVGRFKGRKNLRRLLKAKRKHNEERVAKYQQKVEANKEQVNEAFKEKYEKKYFDA